MTVEQDIPAQVKAKEKIVKEYLEKGYSLKESVGIVSDELNLRKNYVYNIAKKI